MRVLSSRCALAGLSLLLLLSLFVFQIYNALGSTQDDAFISYRYARNLANGQGLVFNPGEHVEGYTNFLWTILLSGVIACGGDPVAVAPVLGAVAAGALGALLFLCAVTFARHVRAPGPGGLGGPGDAPWEAGVVSAAFFVAGSAVAAEAVQGLETSLFALLVTGAILLDASERERGRTVRSGRSGWLYALAALTRPEGLLALAVAAALRAPGLVRRRDARGAPITLGAELRWGARATLLPGAHLLFRWQYYGDLVPNTFHAKVALTAAVLGRGAGYLLEFAGAYLPVLLLAGTGIYALRRTEAGRLLGAWILTHLMYVTWVGGDYKPTFRFFAPVIPGVCLVAGVGLTTLFRGARGEGGERAGGTATASGPAVLRAWILAARGTARAALGRLAILSAGILWLWKGSEPARGFTEVRRSLLPTHEAAGRWLASHFPPQTLLATNNAGALPYYSGLPTIDMLGLCDRTIARRRMPAGRTSLAGHEKGDGAYILSRRPELILFMQARFTAGPLALTQVGQGRFGVSEEELWKDESFHRLYRLTSAPLPGFIFNYFERIDPATHPPGLEGVR